MIADIRDPPGVCIPHFVGAIQDNVSLLVAGLDLALVQSVLSAIRTADLSRPPESAHTPANSVTSSHRPASSLPGQSTVQRNCDYPAATWHPHEVENPHHPRAGELLPYVCTRPVEAPHHESTIQPPWKVLPWPATVRHCPSHCYQQVKILPNRDDVTTAGRLLDVFV
jgi:hypothetical protein